MNIIKPEKILEEVCNYFDLPQSRVQGQSQKREVVVARQIFTLLCRKHTRLSLKAIGEHLNGRDHTTQIHSINTIIDLMQTDKAYRTYVIDIEEKLFTNRYEVRKIKLKAVA
jgi:chromosomal replication initiator protein